MERAARAVADKLSLELDVVEAAIGDGASPEAMARAARYDALYNALDPGEVLLVAHTLDDQAETVLANVLRGTGVAGLAGMPATRGRLARPLLDVRRDTLRELSHLAGLPFDDDPANLDLSLRRNFIRHRLLGVIERSVAPGASASLVRLAQISSEESALLDAEAERRLGPGLRAPLLVTAPVALARRHIRTNLLDANAGNGLRRRDIDAVLALAAATPSAPPVTLPSGATVRRDGHRLLVEPEPHLAGHAEGDGIDRDPVAWDVTGEAFWGSGWRFTGHTLDAPPVFSLSSWSEVFDADVVGERAVIRAHRSGDRIGIRDGSKAISDVLAEAKIGGGRRAGWPVVEVAGVIVWVPGVRRADVGWVGTATRRYLCLGAVQEDK